MTYSSYDELVCRKISRNIAKGILVKVSMAQI